MQQIVDGTEDLDIVLDMLRNGQVITNLGMITGFLDIFRKVILVPFGLLMMKAKSGLVINVNGGAKII